MLMSQSFLLITLRRLNSMDQPSVRQLEDVISVLISLVRSSHLKRVMPSINPDPHLNFWRVIYGNLLDIVVLEWCKLFGSDDASHQPTHWKNIVPVSDHVTFRGDLLQHLKIGEDRWAEYWKEMKNYRDMCVAHDDTGKRSHVPNYPRFDIALESSYFYYHYVIKELRNRGIKGSPANRKAYCNGFAKQAEVIGRKAMAATADMKERVR
jgi:hypothetical protein